MQDDLPPAHSTPPFKCRGFLVKLPVHGHLFSRPHQRFFSITDDAIEWFVDKHTFQTGGDCRGRLPLAQARTEWKAVSYTHLTLPTICSV
eukprot:6038291-Prymnesium_polylepis.1